MTAGGSEQQLEIEVLGPSRVALEEIERLVALALASAGIASGHVAVEFVSAERITELNAAHRRKDAPTDVLSFPVDGPGPATGPRELGDVVVCAARSHDPVEVVVHGVLHLCGMDHEADSGEMLVLQDRVMAELG